MRWQEISKINKTTSLIYCESEKESYAVKEIYKSGVLTVYYLESRWGVFDIPRERFFKYSELLDEDYKLL